MAGPQEIDPDVDAAPIAPALIDPQRLEPPADHPGRQLYNTVSLAPNSIPCEQVIGPQVMARRKLQLVTEEPFHLILDHILWPVVHRQSPQPVSIDPHPGALGFALVPTRSVSHSKAQFDGIPTMRACQFSHSDQYGLFSTSEVPYKASRSLRGTDGDRSGPLFLRSVPLKNLPLLGTTHLGGPMGTDIPYPSHGARACGGKFPELGPNGPHRSPEPKLSNPRAS